MKFIIKKSILLENLYNVSKAISSKNLIPILSGIKFELTKKGLYLCASDSDISIQSFIDDTKINEISNVGSIVIQGRYIVEIIKKLPDNLITIEVLDGYKMIISTENSVFNLNGINPNEFPNLYLEETKEPIILSTIKLKEIINQTIFAISNNESRPLLTGINLKIDNDNLEVIATDSYRLARKVIGIDKCDNNINIVIPGRNLLELIKIINDEKVNIEAHIFNNKILFKYKNILFQSRLLNGTYPATSSIIPNKFDISFSFNINSLYEMIDRASLLTSDKDKNTIKLEINNKKLIISSTSLEIGKVEETSNVECDKNLIISFSSKYMLEALKSFDKEVVSVNINNDSSPIILTAVDDITLTQLILPIKTY